MFNEYMLIKNTVKKLLYVKNLYVTLMLQNYYFMWLLFHFVFLLFIFCYKPYTKSVISMCVRVCVVRSLS